MRQTFCETLRHTQIYRPEFLAAHWQNNRRRSDRPPHVPARPVALSQCRVGVGVGVGVGVCVGVGVGVAVESHQSAAGR